MSGGLTLPLCKLVNTGVTFVAQAAQPLRQRTPVSLGSLSCTVLWVIICIQERLLRNTTPGAKYGRLRAQNTPVTVNVSSKK